MYIVLHNASLHNFNFDGNNTSYIMIGSVSFALRRDIFRIDSLRDSLTPNALSYTLQLNQLTKQYICEPHQLCYKSLKYLNLGIYVA